MNITSFRSLWYTFSGILLGLSIATIFVFGFNLGLDFTGGARWNIQFQAPETETKEVAPEEAGLTITDEEGKPIEATVGVNAEESTAPTESHIDVAELRSFFKSQEILTQDAIIQAAGHDQFLITVQDLSDENIQHLATELKNQFGDFEEIAYRKVDSSIGKSFQRKAFYAIIASLIGIILFVAWAFRQVPKSVNPWRFGGVAIIALFHDVLIILGVFLLLGYLRDVELDLQFITALLATLGFSVNDTIVILDRVRENIRNQKQHETFADTVEKSVQQTLLRSINTSISTLLPLIALLIWGADSIFYFVLALTIGIAVGTYSSIFLAAPLLVTWKSLSDRRG